MEKVELKEMPTKEVLEAYLAQMVLGGAVQVYFNADEGRFIDDRNV